MFTQRSMKDKNSENISFSRGSLYGTFIEYTESILDTFSSGRVPDLSNLKVNFLRHLVDVYNKQRCSELAKSNVEYLEEVKRGLLAQGNAVLEIDARLGSVCLVSASSGLLQGVFEIGLSWDYIRDSPFIPSSSIKGAARSVSLSIAMLCPGSVEEKIKQLARVFMLFGFSEASLQNEVDELLARFRQIESISKHRASIKAELVKLLGRVSSASGMLFFSDSYPVDCPSGSLVRGWVITPHYRDADDEYEAKPIPLQHVVLSEGVVFRFLIGVPVEACSIIVNLLSPVLGVSDSATNDISQACTLLTALMKLVLSSGIGARTSKGYGRFEIEKARIYEPD